MAKLKMNEGTRKAFRLTFAKIREDEFEAAVKAVESRKKQTIRICERHGEWVKHGTEGENGCYVCSIEDVVTSLPKSCSKAAKMVNAIAKFAKVKPAKFRAERPASHWSIVKGIVKGYDLAKNERPTELVSNVFEMVKAL